MHISIWITSDISCWNFRKEHVCKLQNTFPDLKITYHSNKRSFKDALLDTDIALVWYFKQEWLEFAPELKWIVTPAAGRDYFQVDPPSGLEISYSSFHGEIIAETVLGAMLSFTRGIINSYQLQNENLWARKKISHNIRTLKGAHLVILGFGNIGCQIGRLAKPFGVRITGIKQKTVAPPEYFDKNDRIATIEEFNSILPQADHLILTLPRTKSTDLIMDEKRLGLLPVHAYIYNVGRGNVLDEQTLAKILKKGKISGAYLDVFQTEPLPDNSPLRDCKNIILTPHISATSPSYLNLFLDEFIEKFKHKFRRANSEL